MSSGDSRAREIELERKQKLKPQIVQEDWGDEEPVLTEGAKRRMRAEAAAAEASAAANVPSASKPSASPAPAPRELSPAKDEPPKEPWELEAEQGNLFYSIPCYNTETVYRASD